MTTSRREMGAWGEQLAQEFLQRHGYEIVTRNYFTRWGEIDVVARRGDEWNFVEVKLRTVRADRWGQWAGSAERAIDYQKQRHWTQAVRAFCFTYGLSPDHTSLCFEQISMYVNRSTRRVRIIKYRLPMI